MSDPLIDTPQALDAAIAASLEVRRDRLARKLRTQTLRVGVVFGMTGCMALGALAALFVVHDSEVAAVIAMMTLMTFGFTYVAWKYGRGRLLDDLRAMDQVTNSRSYDC